MLFHKKEGSDDNDDDGVATMHYGLRPIEMQYMQELRNFVSHSIHIRKFHVEI